MSKCVEIGHIVKTVGVNTLSLDDNELKNILNQHRSGYWGDVDESIKTINDMNFKQQHGEIISQYPIKNQSMVVVTTWDRSLTTVLLQEEYED